MGLLVSIVFDPPRQSTAPKNKVDYFSTLPPELQTMIIEKALPTGKTLSILYHVTPGIFLISKAIYEIASHAYYTQNTFLHDRLASYKYFRRAAPPLRHPLPPTLTKPRRLRIILNLGSFYTQSCFETIHDVETIIGAGQARHLHIVLRATIFSFERAIDAPAKDVLYLLALRWAGLRAQLESLDLYVTDLHPLFFCAAHVGRPCKAVRIDRSTSNYAKKRMSAWNSSIKNVKEMRIDWDVLSNKLFRGRQ